MWVTCRRVLPRLAAVPAAVLAVLAVLVIVVMPGNPVRAGTLMPAPRDPASASSPAAPSDNAAAKPADADLNASLTRLVRAMNFARLMTIGMDRAFARMPDRIGSIPKEKLKACTYARLSPEVLEQVVRPAFAMTFTDPALMDQLATVFESSFGMKLIELVIENKPMDPSYFTQAEIEEANRFGKAPQIAAFLNGNGFGALMKSIYPYVMTAGVQARESCMRELLPRQVPIQNPRPT
ncbi:hypothetical protein [Cupriavidus sp. RAF12]|uniref:hypothetical protein n=1 Tax=Cupriavidus sp. RAF12 TaxID=3233050 RepID=UPI003F90D129